MQTNYICRSLSGLSLLVLIGIPTFVPALHELFHYHQHLHCTATATDVHLHADVYTCDLCDYLTTFTSLSDIPRINIPDDFHSTTPQVPLHTICVAPHSGAIHLRGPPTQFA